MPVRQKSIRPKHPKNYLKVYAPYLPLLLILGTGLYFSFGSSFKQPSPHVLSYATAMKSEGLLQKTNQERSTSNLEPLQQNELLAKAAQAKAQDMADRDYWSHQTPDGKEPWIFIDKTGYKYTKSAENLAYGFRTSDATIAGWMNSPDHRANILDAELKDVGFGVVNTPNYLNQGPETIVVAMYGKPAEKQAGPAVKVSTTGQSEAKISYLQAMTDGRAPWSGFAAGILVGSVIVYLLLTHNRKVRRLLRVSERFIIKHPLLDMTLIALVALIAVLSQTAGMIR